MPWKELQDILQLLIQLILSDFLKDWCLKWLFLLYRCCFSDQISSYIKKKLSMCGRKDTWWYYTDPQYERRGSYNHTWEESRVVVKAFLHHSSRSPLLVIIPSCLHYTKQSTSLCKDTSTCTVYNRKLVTHTIMIEFCKNYEYWRPVFDEAMSCPNVWPPLS